MLRLGLQLGIAAKAAYRALRYSLASDGTSYELDGTALAADGTDYTLDFTSLAADGTSYEVA